MHSGVKRRMEEVACELGGGRGYVDRSKEDVFRRRRPKRHGFSKHISRTSLSGLVVSALPVFERLGANDNG